MMNVSFATFSDARSWILAHGSMYTLNPRVCGKYPIQNILNQRDVALSFQFCFKQIRNIMSKHVR